MKEAAFWSKENQVPDVSYVAQILTFSHVVLCEYISLVLETGRQKEMSFQFQASTHSSLTWALIGLDWH